MPTITLAEIPASSVVYDHDTRLFPFSPRREIDPSLVERLKHSIAATGVWQPIVVQAGTLEGIAGNHRFLACLEHAAEQGSSIESLRIPAVLIDCDEGLAVSIALIENELRENLTQWEMVRALIKAVERKPEVVEPVFEVDKPTVEQLRFWESELDYENEARERQQALQARLTRQWIALIHDRLDQHPQLRTHFLQQLRHPIWVQAHTLAELDRAITRALLSQGVHFEMGTTWNDAPTSQCLGCQMRCDELLEALRMGKVSPRPDGSIELFCPHLRVFPVYTEQFVPTPDGTAVLETGKGEDRSAYPAEALVQDGQAVQGERVLLLDGLEAYCVAPDSHNPDGCFHQQEEAAAREAAETAAQQGLPAVLPASIREREGVGEFAWHCPQREGKPCTPETCNHANDDPPGFVIVVQPGGVSELVCIHTECGRAAQEALVDWEAAERRKEQQHRRAALDELRKASVERTLLAPPGEGIDLSQRALLEAIEQVLVPDWDTPTMFHVLLGWQAGMRAQIAAALGVDDLADRRVTQEFKERYEQLAERPKDSGILAAFRKLREEVVQSDEDLGRWVACLALVRTWRDEVETEEGIAEANQRIVPPPAHGLNPPAPVCIHV